MITYFAILHANFNAARREVEGLGYVSHSRTIFRKDDIYLVLVSVYDEDVYRLSGISLSGFNIHPSAIGSSRTEWSADYLQTRVRRRDGE